MNRDVWWSDIDEMGEQQTVYIPGEMILVVGRNFNRR
jgi:hypothetical protein